MVMSGSSCCCVFLGIGWESLGREKLRAKTNEMIPNDEGFVKRRMLLKNKKCCCKMCKDYKRGWTNRWKVKEEAKLKQHERTKQTGWYDEE